MNVTIIGGTGTLGQELTRQILDRWMDSHITIISRDELKQSQMSKQFTPGRVTYVLGDIRDKNFEDKVPYSQDVIFHVAALKHIDLLEKNSDECIKTNLLGTQNVLKASKNTAARHMVFCSTDKAVDPINNYGLCKAMSERLVTERGGAVYRWGNVLYSRGSFLGQIIRCLINGDTIPITSKEMTRFWIRIEDAVNFMLETHRTGFGRVLIPDMKSASLMSVIDSLGIILEKTPQYKVVGLRPGEKLHESIKSMYEDPRANSFDYDKYTSSELVALLKPMALKIAGEL